MLIKIIIAAAAVWAYSLWTMFGAYRDAPLLPEDTDAQAAAPPPAGPQAWEQPSWQQHDGGSTARMRMAEGRWSRHETQEHTTRLLGRHI